MELWMWFGIIAVGVVLALPAVGRAEVSIDDLPANRALPNPFVFSDAAPVRSKAEWPKRRAEIKALFETWEYGHQPPSPKVVVTPAGIDRAHAAFDWQTFSVRCGEGDRQIALEMHIASPKNHDSKVPVIIRGTVPTTPDQPTPADDTAFFTDRGYAMVDFSFNDVARDTKDLPRAGGIYDLYGSDIDCGVLMAWAWGFSRAIDLIETRPDLDATKIVVTGHSRYGKAALVAGAFDERITVTAPSHSGAAGAPPYRYLYGKNEELHHAFKYAPQWFGPRFGEFVGHVDRLPIDQHLLKALVAPRALVCIEGTEDHWVNPRGSQLTSLAAREVYKLLGVADDQNTWRFRPIGHVSSDEDVADYADHIFREKPLPTAFGELAYPIETAAYDWQAPVAK